MKASQRPGKKKQKSWVYFLQKKSTATNFTAKPSKQISKEKPELDGSDNTKMQQRKKQRKQNKKLLQQANHKHEIEGVAKVNPAVTGILNENHVLGGKPQKKNINSKLESLNHSQNATNTVETDAKKAKQRKRKEKRKLKIMQRKEKEKVGQALKNSSHADFERPKQHKSNQEEDNSSRLVKCDKDSDFQKSRGKTAARDSVADSSDSCQGTSELKRRKNQKKGTKRKAKRDDGESRKCPKVDADSLDSGMSSGTETPLPPSQPQDVATNWKTLLTKLKSSAPKKHKPGRRKKDLSDDKSKKEENKIWFDDVDPALLEEENITPEGKGGVEGDREGGGRDGEAGAEGADVMSNEITKCVGLDCEMVGVGHMGKDSILARVSMVNQYGQCIYDKFVKPREKVTDYRTAVSGVRPVNLAKAEEFLTVQKEVAAIMKDRVLVGHALKNDMKVLFLGHPRRLIRDTATYPHFREIMKTKRPGLKKLAKTVLGVTIQEGEHSSVVDARTAMRLYTLHRVAWEKSLKQRGKQDKKGS
ncbi:uncharacterized protein [Diadema antillarum]|uniref:uncharacterized protein n=1 Tax=Diadema antillarum TaxID=105358 RepID=UPI003A8A9E56